MQSTARSSLHRLRLSADQLAKRRAKRLCYNCDEVYTSGHKCKRLFHLKEEDEEVEGEEELEPEVAVEAALSMMAALGLKQGDAMEVEVEMEGKKWLGLIDGKRTHNFISAYAA
ncbi:hypothetical protein GUJ93_ZPchr0008g12374 [Zizania palustris]|uniref:Uncharacterized protein n=1 Tax=Zizania palustris TaxID=103762 RepID=A0A8J5RXF6_ZIZPA|nr:hypothetical protein GUJ93_ZPchr0008g12374 [Zizania palustris]